MLKPRKYIKGPEIGPLEVFASVLRGECVMQGDRPLQPSFMLRKRVGDVMLGCQQGQFFVATLNPAHPDNTETT